MDAAFITEVVAAVNRASANVPSGHITEGARDYDARLIGEFQSIQQIEEHISPALMRTPIQKCPPMTFPAARARLWAIGYFDV